MMALLVVAATLVQGEDAPFGLTDIEAYRQALESKSDEPASTVRFRDLWDRPEAYAGKRVTVEGRIARRFRQPGLGELPPLVEVWLMSKAGDPFCVVFPDQLEANASEIGTPVRFSGTFLRKIKYQAGDTARIVPLIVGPTQPSPLSGRERGSEKEINLAARMIEWTMGVGICLMVGFMLLRIHLSRHVPPPRPIEPDPVFIDGEPEEEQTDGESD